MNQKKPEQLESDDTRLGKGPKVLTGRKAFPKRKDGDSWMLTTRAQMLAKTAGRRDDPIHIQFPIKIKTVLCADLSDFSLYTHLDFKFSEIRSCKYFCKQRKSEARVSPNMKGTI